MTQQSPVIEAVELSALADVWRILDTPLMRAVASHEPPLPKLELVEVSIRPLRSDLWPPCPVCQLNVNECECQP